MSGRLWLLRLQVAVQTRPGFAKDLTDGMPNAAFDAGRQQSYARTSAFVLTPFFAACNCLLLLQVAVQTRPGFAKGLTDGMPKLVRAEGAGT